MVWASTVSLFICFNLFFFVHTIPPIPASDLLLCFYLLNCSCSVLMRAHTHGNLKRTNLGGGSFCCCCHLKVKSTQSLAFVGSLTILNYGMQFQLKTANGMSSVLKEAVSLHCLLTKKDDLTQIPQSDWIISRNYFVKFGAIVFFCRALQRMLKAFYKATYSKEFRETNKYP